MEERKLKYKDLKWLIGQPLELKGGIEVYAPPEKVEIIEEYENTVLVEMTFVKSY